MAIFLEGERSSFGDLPRIPAIQYSPAVIALPSGRSLPSLRLDGSSGAYGDRVLAHIAYELAWRLECEPVPSNGELLRAVGWLLGLLGEQSRLMTPERQKGLVGECLFLRTLLMRAKSRGLPNVNALNVWHGFDGSKRDFYSPGVAVEVKATGNATRLHSISSLDQLAAQEPGEDVLLFSVGLRQDRTAPRKLVHYLTDIEVLLTNESGDADRPALELFREQLQSYGFQSTERVAYESEDGFLSPHLSPALYRVADLRCLTKADFVGGRPPETVRSISYELEVVGTEVSAAEYLAVVDRLLGRN